MENTTMTNEVVEEVLEETVKKVELGTILTGGVLAFGVGATIYGVVKGVKWGYKTVKGALDAKKADSVEMEINEDVEVEEPEV